MKKKILSMFLGLTMIMTAMVGCGPASGAQAPAGDAQGDAQPATAAEPTEAVEISFYTTETGKDQMFQDIIKDFESKNPGITTIKKI